MYQSDLPRLKRIFLIKVSRDAPYKGALWGRRKAVALIKDPKRPQLNVAR